MIDQINKEREEANVPSRKIPSNLCRYSALNMRNITPIPWVWAAHCDFLPKNTVQAGERRVQSGEPGQYYQYVVKVTVIRKCILPLG